MKKIEIVKVKLKKRKKSEIKKIQNELIKCLKRSDFKDFLQHDWIDVKTKENENIYPDIPYKNKITADDFNNLNKNLVQTKKYVENIGDIGLYFEDLTEMLAKYTRFYNQIKLTNFTIGNVVKANLHEYRIYLDYNDPNLVPLLNEIYDNNYRATLYWPQADYRFETFTVDNALENAKVTVKNQVMYAQSWKINPPENYKVISFGMLIPQPIKTNYGESTIGVDLNISFNDKEAFIRIRRDFAGQGNFDLSFYLEPLKFYVGEFGMNKEEALYINMDELDFDDITDIKDDDTDFIEIENKENFEYTPDIETKYKVNQYDFNSMLNNSRSLYNSSRKYKNKAVELNKTFNGLKNEFNAFRESLNVRSLSIKEKRDFGGLKRYILNLTQETFDWLMKLQKSDEFVMMKINNQGYNEFIRMVGSGNSNWKDEQVEGQSQVMSRYPISTTEEMQFCYNVAGGQVQRGWERKFVLQIFLINKDESWFQIQAFGSSKSAVVRDASYCIDLKEDATRIDIEAKNPLKLFK